MIVPDMGPFSVIADVLAVMVLDGVQVYEREPGTTFRLNTSKLIPSEGLESSAGVCYGSVSVWNNNVVFSSLFPTNFSGIAYVFEKD